MEVYRAQLLEQPSGDSAPPCSLRRRRPDLRDRHEVRPVESIRRGAILQAG